MHIRRRLSLYLQRFATCRLTIERGRRRNRNDIVRADEIKDLTMSLHLMHYP